MSDAMKAIAHRGPDDCGQFADGAVSFGFVRLAIIDLSAAGHQPMLSADGRHVIVFNGEIYNYRELRAELHAAGHRFVSDSDTEVLLTAYRHWGEDCLARLNGMFSFMVLDRHDGTLFGARDRLGEKPMYVWQNADWTVFASEPRAIAATGLLRLQPDWERLADFVVLGRMDHASGSVLAGVQQVPAASSLRMAPGGPLDFRPYWAAASALSRGADPSSANDWVEELAALATDAVRLRLRSDVAIGFTLSGGIDSSLLICEAAHQGCGRLDAFTYHDAQYDESPLVDATVARTGARRHVVRGHDLQVDELLPRVVAASGEPVHSSSALPNFALFEMAHRSGIKVILGGQGADEIFAGYRMFEHDRWHAMALDGHWGRLRRDVDASARRHGRGVGRLMRGVVSRAMRYALSRTRPYAWLRALRQAVKPPVAAPRMKVFSADFWRRHSVDHGIWVDGRRLVDFQLRALSFSPLPLYLRIEDRMSMAHSVEARLPFTDVRLIEHALRLPEELKFAEGINKVALRAVAARRVPREVTASTLKLGFPVGETDQLAAGLQRLCRELTGTRAFRERGLYDLHAVDALMARPATPADVDPLFHLAQMELWLTNLSTPAPAR